MSHPPETSFSSRELAIRLIQMPVDAVDRGEQLIDAWVRVREAEARLETAKIWHTNVAMAALGQDIKQECRDAIAALESVLAAARKQLKGGPHGQAEAPTAAASANSEPGGG